MTTYYLARYGGLGDALMVLGAAKAIKHQQPESKVHFFTDPAFHPLFSLCPYIDSFNEPTEPYEVHNLSMCQFGVTVQHQIDNYLEALKLPEPDPQYKSIDLGSMPMTKKIATFLSRVMKPCVAIHPGISDPNRTYPLSHWQRLLDLLKAKGYHPVLIGSSKSHDPNRSVFQLEGVPSVIDQLSLLETYTFLQNCDALISADSGPVQLAGAAKIPMVVIYSVINGSARMPFGSKHAIIQAECEFPCCYHYMLKPEIWQAYKLDTIAETFAKWCPAKTDYACMALVQPEKVVEELRCLIG